MQDRLLDVVVVLKRTSIIALMIIIGACESKADIDRKGIELPIFEFRSMIIGKTTSKEAESAGTVYECIPSKDGHFCKLVNQEISGIPIEYPPTVNFNDGKFSGFILETASQNYDRVKYALYSAYGKTCPVEDRLVGIADRWCFKGGDLELRREGIFKDGFASIVYSRDGDVEPDPTYTSKTL